MPKIFKNTKVNMSVSGIDNAVMMEFRRPMAK